MLRRAITLAAALAAVLVVSGCNTVEGQRAQELLLEAQAAEAKLTSAAFEAGLSFTMTGQKVDVVIEGAGSKQGQFVQIRTQGMGDESLDAAFVLRGRSAWFRLNGPWERMPVPAGIDLGGSASLGSSAFQELTKHVQDVRVTEHQVVGGKPATIIAGEIDTVGLLGSLSKLSNLSGSAPSGLGELPDFGELGAKIGDIRAVLTIDEETHLLSTALVKLSVEMAGEQLELELRYRLTAANEPVRIPSPAA